MEIEGRIIQVLPLQQGVSKAGNNWKKQEYVMETLGNFPRKVKFDFFGDRADQNQLEIGKTYVVSYDLESREFNGRWYTDVRAFASRESGQGMAQQQPGQFAAPQSQMPQDSPFPPADASDDLPF